MHIGFRYHVASLVAVFFSLVLGMLIGSALFQNDGLVQEQGHIIADLENRFKALEIRTKTLQASLEIAQEKENVLISFWEQVKPLLISDQLRDAAVVVFVNEGLSNLEGLINLLEHAGANFLGELQLPVTERQIEGLISDFEKPLNKKIAIVYASSNQLDLSSLDNLQHHGWQIGIIHSYDADLNLVDLADKSLVISGIDTPIGELALIQGLSQSITGRYGWGKSFSSLLPTVIGE